MGVKNRYFVILVVVGLFFVLSGCQKKAEETEVTLPSPTESLPEPSPSANIEEEVVVEETAVSTTVPTAVPTAVSTAAPTAVPNEIVFSSNMLAEYADVTISFYYPRLWEVGYFSDSGVSGWLIADSDPNDAFWGASSTGEEILFLIMYADSAMLKNFSDKETHVEVETDNGLALYAINEDEVEGYIVRDDLIFKVFGRFPLEKASGIGDIVEGVMGTFAVEDAGGEEFADVWLLGNRAEGEIGKGETAVGYVPNSSSSEWLFDGTKNQAIGLSIQAHDSKSALIVDVLDQNDHSLLPDGAVSFTDSVIVNRVTIPDDGVYRIQLTASSGFFKTGPWNPPAEVKTYGWYDISVIEPTDAAALPTAVGNKTAVGNETAVGTENENGLNPNWLITANDLNAFSENTGIYEWKVEGDDLLWETRVCRYHLGQSKVYKEHLSINCIISAVEGTSFDSVIDSLYEQEILSSTAVAFDPYNEYDDDLAIFGDTLDNGEIVFDLFLMRDDLVYWNSITIGIPPDAAPETIYKSNGEGIEGLLYAFTSINMGRRDE